VSARDEVAARRNTMLPWGTLLFARTMSVLTNNQSAHPVQFDMSEKTTQAEKKTY
jgi:hypothetical protein